MAAACEIESPTRLWLQSLPTRRGPLRIIQRQVIAIWCNTDYKQSFALHTAILTGTNDKAMVQPLLQILGSH